MLSKKLLEELYILKLKSAKEISLQLACSENKVHYWLNKYLIQKRNIKEATYLKANPSGDPFKSINIKSTQQWFLYGLGLGMYWGEGNKANTHAVRLGNTDPGLIRYFLHFLHTVYCIDQKRLRFGLQIFTDTKPLVARDYWCKELHIKPAQFHKVVITKQGKTGSYTKKLQYGVLTVYFSNRKLRDTIVGAIDELRSSSIQPM